MPHVLSVNVGASREAEWAALGATSMDKRPVAGPVEVTHLGITTDTVTDIKHHGGVDQAIYVFAREDLDLWGERLGTTLANGHFAENLTTEGIDVNEAEVGERWRIGTVLLEVCSIRTPCNDFKNWMGVTGRDNRAWVKRFAMEARPGPYLRVLEEGRFEAGDEIRIEHRPGHGLSVSLLFRALNLDPALRARFIDPAALAALGSEPRRKISEYAAGLA